MKLLDTILGIICIVILYIAAWFILSDGISYNVKMEQISRCDQCDKWCVGWDAGQCPICQRKLENYGRGTVKQYPFFKFWDWGTCVVEIKDTHSNSADNINNWDWSKINVPPPL